MRRTLPFSLLGVMLLFSSSLMAQQNWAEEPAYGSNAAPSYSRNTKPAYSARNKPSYVAKQTPAQHRITVYGRTSCGWTKKYMQDLQKAGIPYTYKSIDDPGIAIEASNLLRASGDKSETMPLPVIDIDGKTASRPDIASLITQQK